MIILGCTTKIAEQLLAEELRKRKTIEYLYVKEDKETDVEAVKKASKSGRLKPVSLADRDEDEQTNYTPEEIATAVSAAKETKEYKEIVSQAKDVSTAKRSKSGGFAFDIDDRTYEITANGFLRTMPKGNAHQRSRLTTSKFGTDLLGRYKVLFSDLLKVLKNRKK